MRILRSSFGDIATHLAIEETLLEEAETRGPALLFSRNRPAVVFGKNQNAWREARPGRLLGGGVSAARRDSGGGAVYHDNGCLNFSLVLPRAEFQRERQFRVLLRVLERLGVRAELAGGSSLTVGGRKISGNAFALRPAAALHHGTLLFDPDLRALERALEPPPWTVTGRGVPSVRMPVAGLAQLAPEATEARWIEGLAAEAAAEWGRGAPVAWEDAGALAPGALARRRDRWTRWDWAWGASPPSRIARASRLPDGTPAELEVSVRAGLVESVRMDDARGTAPQGAVAAAWTGRRFGPETPPPPGLDEGWRVFLIGFCLGEA